MPQFRVYYLPNELPDEDLASSTCVVIDVLRATTTIVHALAAGAKEVVPCLTIDDAKRRAAAIGTNVKLAGERGGRPIAGFDLGNSPGEFTPATVGGKTVVFTTTNGTKVLLRCGGAAEILVAAFANLSAVCKVLRDRTRVNVVCAGTDGQLTREDVLLAGAITAGVTAAADWELNDAASIARDAWRHVADDNQSLSGPIAQQAVRLIDALHASRGGQNLIDVGLAHDIITAAEVDRFSLVPRFDPATGTIRAEGANGLA